MRVLHLGMTLILAATGVACDSPGNIAGLGDAARAGVEARAPHMLPANGTFTQTGIMSLEVRAAGPNTMIEQTSVGSISGTISGTYEDDLAVTVHPDGSFNASFTIEAVCEVGGRSGTLTFRAQDQGEMIAPGTGAFQGTAVITGGSGDLADVRGTLVIEGTVDLASGLSTYDYVGDLLMRP